MKGFFAFVHVWYFSIGSGTKNSLDTSVETAGMLTIYCDRFDLGNEWYSLGFLSEKVGVKMADHFSLCFSYLFKIKDICVHVIPTSTSQPMKFWFNHFIFLFFCCGQKRFFY